MGIKMSKVQEVWVRRGFISFKIVRSTFSYNRRYEHKLGGSKREAILL
jgi:hypothetical protein